MKALSGAMGGGSSILVGPAAELSRRLSLPVLADGGEVRPVKPADSSGREAAVVGLLDAVSVGDGVDVEPLLVVRLKSDRVLLIRLESPPPPSLPVL